MLGRKCRTSSRGFLTFSRLTFTPHTCHLPNVITACKKVNRRALMNFVLLTLSTKVDTERNDATSVLKEGVPPCFHRTSNLISFRLHGWRSFRQPQFLLLLHFRSFCIPVRFFPVPFRLHIFFLFHSATPLPCRTVRDIPFQEQTFIGIADVV